MALPPSSEIDDLVRYAEKLADASGAAIMPYFRTEAGIENKATRGFDPVTLADRAAEAAIRAAIEADFPDHGILGEEFGEKAGASPYRWVIDPIDGTRAFIAGLPLWGTLIALTYDGAPLIGVLDQPYLGERFLGRPGSASLTSRLGVQSLAVRACGVLTDAVLSTTDPELFTPAERGAFDQVRAAARLTRLGCDCYAYGMLAAGRIDLVIESGLKPYDILALMPIIEGAGGLTTNWVGGSAANGGQVIAAASRAIHAEALVALKRSAV